MKILRLLRELWNKDPKEEVFTSIAEYVENPPKHPPNVDVFPCLIKFTRDSRFHVKQNALKALLEISKKESGKLLIMKSLPTLMKSLPTLMDLWENCEDGCGVDLRSIILSLGEMATPELEKVFKSENLHSRVWALDALVKIKGKEATQLIIEALEDPDISGYVALNLDDMSLASDFESELIQALEFKEARMNISHVLGNIGDVESVPPLVGLLDDPDGSVQLNTLESLMKILHKCSELKEVDRFWENFSTSAQSLSGKNLVKREVGSLTFILSDFRIECAKKRNELTKDKGILLDDKPKPPNKNKIYHQLRRHTNG
jgi:hypothetical protein